MGYRLPDLPLQVLLPHISRAEDQLARLDERTRRSPVGTGFVERGHFFDSAASMWVSGELVHVEDLVLHDAHMDVRTPTHELVIAHSILRARRRIATTDPGWALSDAGISALRGRTVDAVTEREGEGTIDEDNGGGALDLDTGSGDDEFAQHFADIDAVLARSERLLTQHNAKAVSAPPAKVDVSGRDPLIYDQDWDEAERLSRWRDAMSEADVLPPSLGASVLWDAWETLEPLQRQHWLGSMLIGSYLRSRGKVGTHLLAFNVGLKAIGRERRRSPVHTTRLIAFLDALSSAAEAGMKELDRLGQTKDQMERRLRNRRSSSSLPNVLELVLSRPIVSAAMIAKAAKVTPRGALNLVAELGVREMTGRGRYRGWGIL
ncbi:RHE_PE00001 family protein [Mesorhizobium sp. M0977]|uniref:RHE_PE00001 family protein n=1 Tax=Mesorhizobium sp. M0977 TaxID=2957039 RepID=UPI003338DB15